MPNLKRVSPNYSSDASRPSSLQLSLDYGKVRKRIKEIEGEKNWILRARTYLAAAGGAFSTLGAMALGLYCATESAALLGVGLLFGALFLMSFMGYGFLATYTHSIERELGMLQLFSPSDSPGKKPPAASD
jgi:hypothetical protein